MGLQALDTYPRARLWELTTPVDPAPRLAEAIGAASVLIKRDDSNAFAFGGNKVRQLEYYLGAAKVQGADTLLMTGAVQSNFVRIGAAAAAKLGMACHIQLENRVAKFDPTYKQSGNVLLDELFGAVLHSFPEGEDEAGADRSLKAIAETLRGEGRTPYIVPMHPSHLPLGALGYVQAAIELGEQGLDGVDEIFVASGSGNTHAGLLYGLRALGIDVPVTGICVRRPAAVQINRITGHLAALEQMLGANGNRPADIVLDDAALAPGYGQAGPAAGEALVLAAQTEGLVLDPVYTAKAMAGLIAAARTRPDRRLMFIHTGGSPAIFAYAEDVRRFLAGR